MSVTVVYANEQPPDAWDASVFIAGPMPRTADVPSWRPAALKAVNAAWRGGRTSVGLGTTARQQRAWLTKVIVFALLDIDVALGLLSQNGQLMAPWSRLLILVAAAGCVGFALLIPIVTRYSWPHFLIAPSLRENSATSRIGNGR